MAIIQTLYGNVGMAPLMIIASVPLYNVMAVAVLSFLKPGSHGMSRQMVMRTLKGIAANPIILGIVTGLVWSMLRLPLPTILYNTVNNLGKQRRLLVLWQWAVPFILEKYFHGRRRPLHVLS